MADQEKGKILRFRPRKTAEMPSIRVLRANTTDEVLDLMATISPAMLKPEIRERVRKMIEDPNQSPAT